MKEVIHEAALKRVAKGNCATFIPLLKELAQQGRSTNAGKAAVTFSFIEQEESVGADCYVPEITVSVRTLES